MSSLKHQIIHINPDSIQVLSKMLSDVSNRYETLERRSEDHQILESEKSLKKDLKKVLDGYYNEFKLVKQVFSEDVEEKVIQGFSKIANKAECRKIGTSFLNQTFINTPIYSSSIIPSLTLDYWLGIRENSLKDEKIKPVLQNLQKYYRSKMDERIKRELEKVPINIDESIKNEYKKAYYNKRISFQEFLDLSEKRKKKSKVSKKQGQKGRSDTEKIRKDFEKALEKKKITQKKRKQMDSFDNYEQYFNMNEREIRRAKRSGKIKKRKYKRNSRRRKHHRKKSSTKKKDKENKK